MGYGKVAPAPVRDTYCAPAVRVTSESPMRAERVRSRTVSSVSVDNDGRVVAKRDRPTPYNLPAAFQRHLDCVTVRPQQAGPAAAVALIRRRSGRRETTQ